MERSFCIWEDIRLKSRKKTKMFTKVKLLRCSRKSEETLLDLRFSRISEKNAKSENFA